MRRAPLAANALDSTDRRILNRLQDGFPLTKDPFTVVGLELGLPGEEIIARIGRLREIGAITRFGPFIDAEAMGGAFCLCAMEVPADRYEEVAAQVNAHREVAHNYARDHRLNMWFVLACEQPAEIARVAGRIERETGLTVLRFPKEREFFIGFRVTA